MTQSKYTPEQRKRRYEAVKRHRARNPNYDKEWRLRNATKINPKKAVYAARRRKEQPERVKASLAKWRAKNKDYILEYKRKWKAAHRVEEALAQRGRNAKTKTKIDKTQICNWESRICGICNLFIEDKFHIDHKIPLAKGGLHVVENLQLAHPSCNWKKKDKLDYYIK